MHVMFLSQNGLVLDHPLPIGKMVNGQYYCALLQDKVRPAVHCKQPDRLEYRTMQHLIAIVMLGLRRWHILPPLQILH